MTKEIIDKMYELKESNIYFVTATITQSEGSSPASVGQNLIVTEKGDVFGTVGGGLIEDTIKRKSFESIENGENCVFEYNLEDIGMSCGGRVKGFIQVVKNDNRIVIIGGGHIGKKLYDIGKNLEFQFTIVDDREEFCNEDRFPGCKIVCCKYEDILQNVVIDKNTYVILVTRGHDSDYKSLKEVVKKSPKYVGMIGSKKKTIEIKRQVAKECEDESIYENLANNIYAPIGLNIAKNNPAEIAISIFAEILLLKNAGTLNHLNIEF